MSKIKNKKATALTLGLMLGLMIGGLTAAAFDDAPPSPVQTYVQDPYIDQSDDDAPPSPSPVQAYVHEWLAPYINQTEILTPEIRLDIKDFLQSNESHVKLLPPVEQRWLIHNNIITIKEANAIFGKLP